MKVINGGEISMKIMNKYQYQSANRNENGVSSIMKAIIISIISASIINNGNNIIMKESVINESENVSSIMSMAKIMKIIMKISIINEMWHQWRKWRNGISMKNGNIININNGVINGINNGENINMSKVIIIMKSENINE
jgi:hypothetical protein